GRNGTGHRWPYDLQHELIAKQAVQLRRWSQHHDRKLVLADAGEAHARVKDVAARMQPFAADLEISRIVPARRRGCGRVARNRRRRVVVIERDVLFRPPDEDRPGTLWRVWQIERQPIP